MKKSELKKRLIEALTPDEASKVDAKYKEIYAGMVGKNPLKMKKYDNPDKVAYGRAINLIQKESLKLAEKLGKKAKVGDYIEDFTDSDAPQFKGKSDKKKKQMAVAAFLNKEEQKLDEIDAMMEDAQEKSEKNYSNYFKKMDKNRLNELVKAALMKETSTDKYDDNPALKGKQSELPDGLQKAIIKKSGGKVDEIKERILKELRGNINEALNKPLDKFGQDLEKRLNALGFETKVFGGQETVPSSAVDQIQKNPKLAGMSYIKLKPGEKSIPSTSDRDYEYIEVVVNSQKLNQLKKVKSYFQTADGNYGPDKKLGWITKNVKKTNPGDIIGSDIQKYGDRAILSYHTSLPGGEKVKTRDA